jgi:hypothetical protein
LSDHAVQNGDILSTASIVDGNFCGRRGEGFAQEQNPLCEGVTNAVGVGVFDVLVHAEWPKMNVFAWERVLAEVKPVPARVEIRVLTKDVSCEVPELFIEAVEDLAAVDANSLHNFVVEVLKEFLTGSALASSYFTFQLMLELVEFGFNLLRCTTLLVYSGDSPLEVYARFDST